MKQSREPRLCSRRFDDDLEGKFNSSGRKSIAVAWQETGSRLEVRGSLQGVASLPQAVARLPTAAYLLTSQVVPYMSPMALHLKEGVGVDKDRPGLDKEHLFPFLYLLVLSEKSKESWSNRKPRSEITKPLGSVYLLMTLILSRRDSTGEDTGSRASRQIFQTRSRLIMKRSKSPATLTQTVDLWHHLIWPLSR